MPVSVHRNPAARHPRVQTLIPQRYTQHIDSMTIFDYPHYEATRKSRLRNFFHHFDVGSLAGKRILEVGCGTGDLGQAFVDVGCRVVSVDARAEYIEELNRRYPDRETYTKDLECWNPRLLGPFDGLLCWGLLYHLSAPGDFLTACAGVAPLIFLETAVSDSMDAVCPLTDEEGPDQAWSGKGCRPSPAWLQQHLSALGFEVRDISTVEANWDGPSPSVFDWVPLHDGQWQRNGAMLRKMLIGTRWNKAHSNATP